ncbi:UNVERIFIED_ORG: multidrug efflux pump subunit AcrA (membrane-fusion protein) [Xanthomonas axonopodis]
MLVLPSARVCAALLLAAVLAGCSRQASTPAAAKPIPVSVQAVATQPWNSTVQSIATVRARESVALTAAVSDVVEQVYFDSGDEVKAGQLLLRLRGNSQQAALTAAQATFEETDQLYRRQLSLVGQQLVAKSTVDTQRALRDAAQARVQQMRAEIIDREVRAAVFRRAGHPPDQPWLADHLQHGDRHAGRCGAHVRGFPGAGIAVRSCATR